MQLQHIVGSKLCYFTIYVFLIWRKRWDCPGIESMGKPWKNHGKSMGKIPWIPLQTMEHGAGAKFHGFHGEIPMLSMLAWDSKNCKITPHESME